MATGKDRRTPLLTDAASHPPSPSLRLARCREEDSEPLFDAVNALPVSPTQPAVPDELGVRGWEEGVRVTDGCPLSDSEYTIAMWVRLQDTMPQGSQILLQGAAAGQGNFYLGSLNIDILRSEA